MAGRLETRGAWPARATLLASAVALVLAPLLLPASYSWVAHTTSEAAAQGLPGAWLARSGFVLFGLGVTLVALLARARWGRWAVALHLAFALFMIGAATFSARPWDTALPYSRMEDLLHSVAATAMGFAFAFGVAVVAVRRWRREGRWLARDLVAVAASVVLPTAMGVAPGLAGALQRAMFLIAYVWYALEAHRASHHPRHELSEARG